MSDYDDIPSESADEAMEAVSEVFSDGRGKLGDVDLNEVLATGEEAPGPQAPEREAQEPQQPQRTPTDYYKERAERHKQVQAAQMERARAEQQAQWYQAQLNELIARTGQQPIQPQPQQRDEFEELDPDFKRYMEAQVGKLSQEMQATLRPLQEAFLYQQQRQQQEYQAREAQWRERQAIQAVQDQANEYIAMEPEYPQRWTASQGAFAEALQEMGLPQNQAEEILRANALGYIHLSKLTGLPAPYIADTILKAQMRAFGNGAKAEARAQPQQARPMAQPSQQVAMAQRATQGGVVGRPQSVAVEGNGMEQFLERGLKKSDIAKIGGSTRTGNLTGDSIRNLARLEEMALAAARG